MGNLKVWEAVATMMGAIVGAGIFGIPYVVSQAGFLTGALCIIIVGLVVLLLYLYLGEVVLRTKGKHQLTGYAEIYLGGWGKILMAFSLLFGIYGAMTAYLIGEGAAISSILGGPPMLYMLLFFVFAAAIVHMGLNTIEKSELLTMFLIFIVVVFIILFTIPHISIQNLREFSISRFFMPFGVVLFAFLGMVAIPEAKEILERDKKSLRKAICTGMGITIVLYLIFALVVVGSVGPENFSLMNDEQRIATIALGKAVGHNMFVFANLFAVFAMFTSFIALAFALKEMFMYDYGMNKDVSWALTCFIPLLIVLAGLSDFIEALNVVGVVSGGLSSILIVLMFHKAKRTGSREPEYSMKESMVLSVAISALFISGAVFLLIQ